MQHLHIHAVYKRLVIKMGVQVLTFGQAYQISLQLEMPDSPVNQALGMFLIRTTFYSQDGGQLASSAQPVRRMDVCYAKLKSCCFVLILCTIAVCSSGRTSAVGQQLSFCKFTSRKLITSDSQSHIRLEFNVCGVTVGL